MSFNEEIKLFNNQHKVESKNIEGVNFNYILSGSGEKKIVLLTAGSGMYEAFYKHINLLEKNYTVLAFEYPENINNIKIMVDSIAELINSLCFTNVCLVGESLGGCIAQLFINRHPNLVDKVILTNTGSITEEIDYKMKDEILDGIESTVKTIERTPNYFLKSALTKKAFKKVKEDLGNTVDLSYVKDFISYMIEHLTKEKAIHLCNLALNFVEEISFDSNSFNDFKGKVYIINTKDDDLMDPSMKEKFASLFNDYVVIDVNNGGHEMFLFKVDEYIEIIKGIMA